jgi:hypothetical protein
MFFTSIFCGSAVHILDDVIADSEMLSAGQGDRSGGLAAPSRGNSKPGPQDSDSSLRSTM